MSILSRNYRYRFSAMITGYRWRLAVKCIPRKMID